VYIWIGIIILACVVEIHTFVSVAVWFIPSALTSFALSLTGIQVWTQALVFFVLSLMLLAVARTVFKKSRKYKNANSDSVIGKTAIVTEEINNYKYTGTVRVNGLTWVAKSDDDDIIYESGLVVTIVNIDGVDAICSR
jgi:membrane protein implicated in regulation of membrane protease activity